MSRSPTLSPGDRIRVRRAVLLAWQELDGLSTDGLTFKEWAWTVFAALVIGGVVARLGYLAIGFVDRRWFDGGDE